jgi:hypothetical protein
MVMNVKNPYNIGNILSGSASNNISMNTVLYGLILLGIHVGIMS